MHAGSINCIETTGEKRLVTAINYLCLIKAQLAIG